MPFISGIWPACTWAVQSFQLRVPNNMERMSDLSQTLYKVSLSVLLAQYHVLNLKNDQNWFLALITNLYSFSRKKNKVIINSGYRPQCLHSFNNNHLYPSTSQLFLKALTNGVLLDVPSHSASVNLSLST